MSSTILNALASDFLGLVFLVAAVSKMREPKSFELAVLEYRVLSPATAHIAGRWIPAAELGIALLLLGGTDVGMASVCACIMLAAFTVATVANIARGREIECHCFGGVAFRRTGWTLVAENVTLIGVGVFVLSTAHGLLGAGTWSILSVVPVRAAQPTLGISACVGCAIAASFLTSAGRLPGKVKWRQSPGHPVRVPAISKVRANVEEVNA